MKILHRESGAVLFEDGQEDLRDTIESACRLGVALHGASLRGADLHNLDLTGARMSASDLREANLNGTNFRLARLRAADLQRSSFRAATLSGADLGRSFANRADFTGAVMRGVKMRETVLRFSVFASATLAGADLRGSRFHGVDFAGVNLEGVNLRRAKLKLIRVNWSSHQMIGELLRRAAGDDPHKRALAGLVTMSTDWDWNHWTRLEPDPHFGWALETLASYLHDDEEAPALIRRASLVTRIAMGRTRLAVAV